MSNARHTKRVSAALAAVLAVAILVAFTPRATHAAESHARLEKTQRMITAIAAASMIDERFMAMNITPPWITMPGASSFADQRQFQSKLVATSTTSPSDAFAEAVDGWASARAKRPSPSPYGKAM